MTLRVAILGAGKVGRGLFIRLRRAGVPVRLRSDREGLPPRPIRADLLVLAVREARLAPLSRELAARRLVGKTTACVHVAGSLGPEALVALRGISAGVAQMHPMISFAEPTTPPSLLRGNLEVQGDPVAVRRARWLGKKLGMTPRTIEGLDVIGYHAAAGLVANGAAALAAIGARLLVRSGVPDADAHALLGPLLRSVADNVEALGFPAALTGPVRRGDAAAVQKHLNLLEQRAPEALPLFVAATRAQIPIARSLRDAPPGALDAVEAVLKKGK